jgi:hypothetical protein
MDACFNAPRTKLLTIVGRSGTRLRVMDTLGCLYPGAPAKVENAAAAASSSSRIASRWPSARSASCRSRSSIPSGSTAYGLRVNVGGRVVALLGRHAVDARRSPSSPRTPICSICECTGYDAPSPVAPALSASCSRRCPSCRPAARPHAPRRSMLAHLGELGIEVAEDGQTIR